MDLNTYKSKIARFKQTELAEAPKLTLAIQIWEDQYTLAGKEFVCEGELGLPTGRMDIESDFAGDFAPFLSLQNRENDVAFINENLTTSDEKTCSYTQTIKYAFHKALLDYHLKRFRCVTYSYDDAIDQVPKYSEEEYVIVLKSKLVLFSVV